MAGDRDRPRRVLLLAAANLAILAAALLVLEGLASFVLLGRDVLGSQVIAERHLTAEGNALAARVIHARLVDLGLLPEAPVAGGR